MSFTLLCKKKICPPRFISLSHASLITVFFQSDIYVFIGILFSGDVAIILRSFIPPKDIFNVLGIGVAVRVRTLISFLNFFKNSLCLTPNFCSSSIIKRPSEL